MATVLDRIRGWARTDLKYWEQLALEKIASGSDLQEADKQELLEAFLAGAGVGHHTARALSFPLDKTPGAATKLYRLERLFDLTNVNALPSGQEIRFGPQLTLVFGGNGVGKTGYARPLACAAFARGEREVLPNAMLPGPPKRPTASIELSCDGTSHTLSWIEGQRLPELAGFYAFDANSLKAHLTQPNSLQFTPAALALLTRLAEVTDDVRSKAKAATLEWERPLDFSLWFEGRSPITDRVANLSANTDLQELRALADLTVNEVSQIDRLELEIA